MRASDFHEKIEVNKLLIMWVLFIILNILDAATTYIGIKYFGAREGNPLSFFWILSFPSWLIFDKLIGIGMFVTFKNWKWFPSILFLANIALLFAVINNTIGMYNVGCTPLSYIFKISRCIS